MPKKKKQTTLASFFGGGKKATKRSSDHVDQPSNNKKQPSPRAVADFVGQSVAKYFLNESNGQEELYVGSVVSVNATMEDNVTSCLYHVQYQDGDEEDMDDEEIQSSLALYKEQQNNTGREDDDDDEEFTMEEDLVDTDEEMEDVIESEEEVAKPVPKKQRRAPSTSRKGSRSSKKASSKTSGMTVQQEFETKLAKDLASIKPKNNPQKWPKATGYGPFVDPVGVDPTQGIVESIIKDQVSKIFGLLQMVPTTKPGQGLSYPIKLQTACSGTDAPSIALGIVKEEYDKMVAAAAAEAKGGTDDVPSLFEYSHEMSCEIEPFKQAYIARNFPGVTLFPDILKLSSSEEVLDVYGRPQTIPYGNLFVAGTSCKDFSMLKTSYRKDIEDKGTSGETFLAAVDFLELQQPPVAIFENVDNAPWGKMQEYICGRVFLGNRNVTKGIKEIKRGDAERELKFSVNEDGRYVAEAVPKQVGIQAGAIVEGILRYGHDSSDVQPLVDEGGNRVVTLYELAKMHKIDLEQDTLVMEKKARYCTHLSKVDTKDYGLPQTRNRKYLFIWRSDDPDDDLGDYFQEILEYLQTPLLHSMDAFLLPDTHDRIRCFREALRSGPGLLVHRARAKELDFWDWELSRVKDLTLHLAYRETIGLAERSRWFTGWDTRGRKKIAPGLWPELVDCWNMRRLDMVDCFAGAAIRDAISRDPLHHTFTWDISQNVSRTEYRASVSGISSCCTPGGELILPYKGRTVMGYEKLLLQGIPFSRLLLGPETEVQLSDLAGNAMSVSVVCATMMAALCAPHLREQAPHRPEHALHLRNKWTKGRRDKWITDRKSLLEKFAFKQKYEEANGAVLPERGDLFHSKREDTADDFVSVFNRVAKTHANDAFRSSVLCTCESSGMSTSDPKILECSSCGMAVCHQCSGRYQVSSHNLRLIDVNENSGRPDAHAFERKLRCDVPSALRLGQGWESCLADGQGLESYTFQLQQVDRMRGHWQLTYGAWEDHCSSRQVAEIRVIIGRTGTLDEEVGVAAYIRCFGPAIRHKNPRRGRLKDSARLFLKCHAVEDHEPFWETPDKKKKCTLSIVGSGEIDSQRVLVGLNDEAARSLKAHKITKQFTPPIQSRNSLTHYHPKWKTWPNKLEVSGEDTVNGTYSKMDCTHSVVLSALWRRESIEGKPPVYLYYRPDVLRTKLDVAVFSTTPSYADNMEVCELHDWIPENALTARTFKTEATFLSWKSLPGTIKVEIPFAQMLMVPQHSSFHERLCAASHQRLSNPILCEMGGLSRGAVEALLEYHDGDLEEAVCEIDLFGRSGTRNAKRLSILAAPLLLKSAAEGKLSLTLSKWYRIPAGSENFGNCAVNVPPRPLERWQERAGGAVERVYDAEESNEYYHRLFSRPRAFQVSVERTTGKLVISMNPHVVAHRAAALLGGESSGLIEVDYCLAELSSMGEPPTREFCVPNSDPYEETAIDDLVLPLYPRQAKALTRMLAIERGKVPFTEEERSEIILPGIGWCLIAKAAKCSPLRGGVLGDAIGSGKTVITIALILAGKNTARANRNVEKGRSSATLVVVPPGLVRQWDDERRKFTGDQLNCITIDSTAKLKQFSVNDLCNADIVIVPAGIIEETTGKARPYTEQLSQKAGAKKIPRAPASYSQREAPTIEGTWVRNMASGPDIYVGNKGDQGKRDAQAYYGHCYSEAITKLRKKKFLPTERGVPIEWFTWERIIIDECHETLVTGKSHETKDSEFKEKSRRGAREFLGVSQADVSKRPLLAATGIWGLTGTPLLETEARITELANLMGGTYLTGAAHHWRKEERESGRDLFLNQAEGVRSREYRCAVQEACHSYVREACQRNRGEELQVRLAREQRSVNMSKAEGERFLKEISELNIQTFSVSADQLGESFGDVVSLTASSKARHSALVETIDSILEDEPETKILVFASSFFGGYESAHAALEDSGRKFCRVSDDSPVEEQNETISWFRHVDVTETERNRPRVLLLSFQQAAGHNLQDACHNVIMYDPYYTGTDAVADASVEEQAVGRVMRQGQKDDVTVTRIVLKGPGGERCLDDWIVERNLDEDVLRAATSNFD